MKNKQVDFKDRESQNNYYTPKIIFDSLVISNGDNLYIRTITKRF